MIYIDNLLKESFAEKEYSDQVEWLIHIFDWLRLAKDNENIKISKERVYSVRIKYLLQLLSRNPGWKENFVSTVSSILHRMSSVTMFTDVGMSLNSSFIQEFIRRFEDKILPQSALTENLSSLLLEIFPNKDESILVDGIDEEILNDVLELFTSNKSLIADLQQNIYLSLYVLTTQLLANAFSIQREIEGAIKDSKDWPESKLQELISHKKIESIQSVLPDLFLCLKSCESLLQRNYDLMQEKGIKVDCVYLLDSQRRRLERISTLLTILDAEKSNAKAIRLFISNLILDIHDQKSLRSFFLENMSLLIERIVRGNSDVGEHYVTFTWKEFNKMYNSAVGGGLLTSLTVYIKIFISGLGLTGFIKGIFDSLNYSASFLFIQSMGWTLATKQPSMTAPYLAQSLKQSVAASRKAVVAILRTQFIAVLGNLTLVFPICFSISWFANYFGSPVMSVSHSLEIIHSSDVLGSAPIFAIFTGGLLFLSSLMAGWFENWVVLHKLPERITNHQNLIRFLGKNRTKKFSAVLKKSANPYAASISLGFLLGLAPQFFKFMGLPIEVRHITLATGSFATALPLVFGQGLDALDFTNAISGLLVIGVFNIIISFILALILAAISSQVKISHLLSLLRWGVLFVLTKPWLLLIPEKKAAATSK